MGVANKKKLSMVGNTKYYKASSQGVDFLKERNGNLYDSSGKLDFKDT